MTLGAISVTKWCISLHSLPVISIEAVPNGSNIHVSMSCTGLEGLRFRHRGQRLWPGRQRTIWQSAQISCFIQGERLDSSTVNCPDTGVIKEGLGVFLTEEFEDSEVLCGGDFLASGPFLCFAACLLVDQGRSLRAFCITKERASRRPWRDVFAALDASTNRNSW